MMTETDHKIAERLKTLMLERGLPIEEVIVFGSRARGDFEEDSDLDLFIVVSHKDRQIKDAIGDCCWEVGYELEIMIQPVVMTREERYNSPQRSSLLVKAIREEGIRV